ncbi:rhomboid family intramembrane serine protease [Paenibacillus chartarius]|uniref:Rhomboid family intramembrane serine protease n=1 Tax=Paenibacillus chartarius TaxID=747481 RepID=A0ABV6DU25_9BACL
MFTRTETMRQFLQRYPLLSLIIAVNAAVFLYTLLRFGEDQPEAVYVYGGILPDALERGEPWRFVTYAFLHSGWMHVIMNVVFMIIVGPPLEYMLGRLRLFALFVLSVLTTSGLVFVIGNSAGVGASGFGYGLLGTLAVMALRRKDLLDRASIQIVWGWIIVGWLGTFIMPGISVQGHLGGFLGGLLFGLLGVGPKARLTPWVPVPPRRSVPASDDEAFGGAGLNDEEERRHDPR